MASSRTIEAKIKCIHKHANQMDDSRSTCDRICFFGVSTVWLNARRLMLRKRARVLAQNFDTTDDKHSAIIPIELKNRVRVDADLFALAINFSIAVDSVGQFIRWLCATGRRNRNVCVFFFLRLRAKERVANVLRWPEGNNAVSSRLAMSAQIECNDSANSRKYNDKYNWI